MQRRSKNEKTQSSPQEQCSFTFGLEAQAFAHDIADEPIDTRDIVGKDASRIVPAPQHLLGKHLDNAAQESVPLDAFCHEASAMQAIARYLVDIRKLTFSQAARILGRSPKSIWASYHQTKSIQRIDESTLRIPLRIFTGTHPPLEALVAHLKATGLRNIEIARALKLDPKTTWTVAKRAEVRA
ncbi:TPA: hypothetical protein HA251_03005 [Candidatus Woesearchaeota archaeon]|nr:hypothetical protein [Candidatus Woesearchaeota archaeon]